MSEQPMNPGQDVAPMSDTSTPPAGCFWELDASGQWNLVGHDCEAADCCQPPSEASAKSKGVYPPGVTLPTSLAGTGDDYYWTPCNCPE